MRGLSWLLLLLDKKRATKREWLVGGSAVWNSNSSGWQRGGIVIVDRLHLVK